MIRNLDLNKKEPAHEIRSQEQVKDEMKFKLMNTTIGMTASQISIEVR